MRALSISLIASAIFAVPALTADPPKSNLDSALAKAKKEKKYVAIVLNQFG